MRCATLLSVSLLMFALPGCLAPDEPQEPDPAVRLIAFGDSTTRGPAGGDYLPRLAERLGLPADATANEGNPGETTSEGTGRLRRLLRREIYPNADTLIYWQGGNDLIDYLQEEDPRLQRLVDPNEGDYRSVVGEALEDIADRIVRNIRRAQDAGLRVYVVTYYPLSTDVICPPLPGITVNEDLAPALDVYRDELNWRIRRAAVLTDAGLIDLALLSDTLEPRPDLYFDCNHLNAAGNAVVAEYIADALETE